MASLRLPLQSCSVIQDKTLRATSGIALSRSLIAATFERPGYRPERLAFFRIGLGG
jgi:hypothetical protein